MAPDELDCGLEEHPPECSGCVELFTLFMTQDTGSSRAAMKAALERCTAGPRIHEALLGAVLR
jgi:hypothetical protein